MHYLLKKIIAVTSILLVLLAAACSNLQRDGPPRWPTDVSKIPNAVPKVEPLSKIGNARRYRVNGKTYYVKKTSRNYKQRGIASWYGTKFHSRATSSGEIYNMMAMTAAHKSLPLPTYVKVTNLRNKKHIIVKVNDRGPFARGRIIDLSYAAAKKIGMTKKGTAYVEVTAIDPAKFNLQHRLRNRKHKSKDNYAPVFSVKLKKSATYFLRIGSFKNRKFAERLRKRVLNYVHSTVQISAPKNNQHYYRVEIGPIRNAVAATLIKHRLKMAGVEQGSIITKQEA